jgi:ribosomal-protein-alanine N-acetyltransferase
MASDTVFHTCQPPGRATRCAFRPLAPDNVGGLCELLESLVASGEARAFHPHAFDRHTLESLCRPAVGPRDEYWVAVEDRQVVAYGLLRGWSEGYEVPSLGIAVHPGARGRGVARSMMEHLHDVARDRGAVRVRLKVYRDNAAAIRLYAALGYRLEPLNDREFLGFADLARLEKGSAA